jgi:adenine-specific DNA glycosylase
LTKKTDVPRLIGLVPQRWPIPSPPIPGDTLVDKGVVMIFTRHMPQPAAEASLASLKKVYEDWNEARVSQVQELAALIKPGKGGKAGLKLSLEAAASLKTYLQEVFQQTHGMTLSELVEDPAGAVKQILQMPFLGIASASYLLWLANEGKIPIHGGLVRVLDRIGLIQRSGSGKKGRELIEPLVPEGKGPEFLIAFGEVADRWCDSRRPLCHECPLVNDCRFGKKAFKEWQALQVRLEVQRKRDEARRLDQERKDAARAKREEARAKKKAEAEAKKKAREADRRRKAHEAEIAKMRAKAQRKAQTAKKVTVQKKTTKKTTKKSTTKSKTGKKAGTSRPTQAAKKPAKARPSRAKTATKASKKTTTRKKSTTRKPTAGASKKKTKKPVSKKRPTRRR